MPNNNPAAGQAVPSVRVMTAPVAGDHAMTVIVSFEVTIEAETVINNLLHWPGWAVKGRNEEVQEIFRANLAQWWPELLVDALRHRMLLGKIWQSVGPNAQQMSPDEFRQTFQEIKAIDRKYGYSSEYGDLFFVAKRYNDYDIDSVLETDET